MFGHAQQYFLLQQGELKKNSWLLYFQVQIQQHKVEQQFYCSSPWRNSHETKWDEILELNIWLRWSRAVSLHNSHLNIITLSLDHRLDSDIMFELINILK